MDILRSLEMLSYCLQQALFKAVPILFDTKNEAAKHGQVVLFAREINKFIAQFKVTEEQLNSVKWYDPTLVELALKAITWDDINEALHVMPNCEFDLDEAYVQEAIEDAKSNRPCDTYGMLACSSSCPDWNSGCRPQ